MDADIPKALGGAQVERFQREGFLALERIADDAEIAWLRDTYARILLDTQALRVQYTGATPAGGAAEITQIFAPELRCPELLQTGYIRNAKRLAASLLGVAEADVSYGGLMLIYKPPGAGLEAPFHQDEAYWEFPGERLSHSVSCWMPLDAVTVDSGCMQFVPRSHELEVMRHRRKAPTEPLELDEPYDVSGAVPCPLEPGGATFHHCRTVHGTGANVSERPRRALTTIFHGPPGQRAVPLSRPWLGRP
jgi:ectoine hydroxylase-related dioxygenase (phytanoyl-CoA dioxygenase family)